MEQNKKISLREEVEKEAKRIDQEISGKHKFDDIKVSKNLDKKLFEQIQEYEKKRAEKRNNSNSINDFSEEFAPELNIASDYDLDEILSEEDKEALRLGRELVQKQKEEVHLHEVNKEYHKHLNIEKHNTKEVKGRIFRLPRKKRLVIALAAVLILVVGTGVTSVGSKSYIKKILNKVIGKESVKIMSVDDMNKLNSADIEEVFSGEEIVEKLKIVPIQLGYKPANMTINSVEINEKQKSAYLFYDYNDQIVRYSIYLNDSDSSIAQRNKRDLTDEFTVETTNQTILVQEYEDKSNSYFIADFSYEGCNYQLKATMEKEKFIKILENLIYFN